MNYISQSSSHLDVISGEVKRSLRTLLVLFRPSSRPPPRGGSGRSAGEAAMSPGHVGVGSLRSQTLHRQKAGTERLRTQPAPQPEVQRTHPESHGNQVCDASRQVCKSIMINTANIKWINKYKCMNKLIQKASNFIGVELDSLTVSERRILSRMQDDESHPLRWPETGAPSASLGHRKSFLPVAVRLYNDQVCAN